VQRNFPIKRLSLFASARSVGKSLEFNGQQIPIQEATPSSVSGHDIVFMSAGATRSREFASAALDSGAIVIDNSSAFRMQPDVPLVVPEVNPDQMGAEHSLLSVANCTAILLCTAISPLRQLGRFDRLIVSTYQSASGGGAMMMEQLKLETKAALGGPPAPDSTLQYPYAFNLFSHNTPIGSDGFNEEECKVIEETRKILNDPGLKIAVTCIRVPVLRAHTETVVIEFADTAPTVESVRNVLSQASGVKLMDDRVNNIFPNPAEASGQDEVLVGRIRLDPSNPKAIILMLCGDQLLKGAALNAVQIAELALAKRFQA
jgi:aspartate-semialdehyde dehydrogenase